MSTPSVKGTLILIRQFSYANTSLSSQPLFSLKIEADLGIGAASGKAHADPPSFWFFLQRRVTFRFHWSPQQHSYSSRRREACGPAQHRSSGPKHASAQFRLKKASSFSLIYYSVFFFLSRNQTQLNSFLIP